MERVLKPINIYLDTLESTMRHQDKEPVKAGEVGCMKLTSDLNAGLIAAIFVQISPFGELVNEILVTIIWVRLLPN
jgi:hypothetical protein